MAKTAEPYVLKSRSKIGVLMQRAASDGRRWADAELALARAELGDLRRRCITTAILAITAFGAVLCAFGVLAQAGVTAVAPYFDSDIAAGLAIGAFLLAIAVLCIIAMRRTMDWHAESLLFRWLAPEPDRKRAWQ